jgi:hypothetical protein
MFCRSMDDNGYVDSEWWVERDESDNSKTYF